MPKLDTRPGTKTMNLLKRSLTDAKRCRDCLNASLNRFESLGGLCRFMERTLLVLFALLPVAAHAQDRLKSVPGYERFQRMSREVTNAVTLGALSVTWTNDSQAFEYRKDGKRYRYDIATKSASLLPPASTNAAPRQDGERRGEDRREGRSRPERPERGRQFTSAASPDGKLKAFYRDRNLWLSETNGTNEIAITTDGSDKTRVKYGAANWVYGEELDQNTAIWWSSNSQKLAFYRFDESQLKDYFLSLDQTKVQSRMDIEPYMKAGATNPLVDILIYDPASRRTTRVDVRDSKPFDNAVVGHYVYGVSWSREGRSSGASSR